MPRWPECQPRCEGPPPAQLCGPPRAARSLDAASNTHSPATAQRVARCPVDTLLAKGRSSPAQKCGLPLRDAAASIFPSPELCWWKLRVEKPMVREPNVQESSLPRIRLGSRGNRLRILHRTGRPTNDPRQITADDDAPLCGNGNILRDGALSRRQCQRFLC